MAAYILVRLVLASLRAVPFPAAFRLARLYLAIVRLTVPRFGQVARRNLEIAALPDPAGIVDEMWNSLARSLAVFARLPSVNDQNIHQWIRYDGFEHYTNAKQRGKGVLFATAHLGNWELSAFAHALMTEPMNIVVRPLDNSRLDDFVEKRRTLSGNKVIGKRDAGRSILRALKRNEPVGVLVDQNVVPSEGVFVNVFGVPACAASGLVRLAAHSGASVIPGFALWSEDEKRYVLRFYPPVAITGDVHCDTQRVQSVVEQAIREHPGQWLWIHRRWKTRPPGEAPLY